MNALVTSQGGMIAIIFAAVALSFISQKTKKLGFLGPALPAIVLGIILSNLKILPHWNDLYGVFFTYFVPISICLLMLNVNIKEWGTLSKQPLLAIGLAVLSVSLVSLVFGFIFAPRISEGWKLAGMFIGTYTGGSSNLTAIGTGLNASPELFAQANAADYVIGIPISMAFFLIPSFCLKSKWFNRIWPYALTQEELTSGDDVELFEKKEWAILDVGILIAIGLMVTQIATVISTKFDPSVSSAVRILSITTLSIILAQFSKIRNIKGSMDLGFYFSICFLVIIGLTIDLKTFATGTPMIVFYCICVQLGALSLHLILCRVFKIKYQYVVISIVAAIADGSFAAMVAGSGKWKSIISIAVVLGVIGAVVGNYVGIGISYLLKGVLGI